MEDLIQEVKKTRHVALYQHTKHGWYSLCEVHYREYNPETSENAEPFTFEVSMSEYVRVSKPFALQLELDTTEAIVQRALEAIAKEEREAREELYKVLAKCQERRSHFLQLAAPAGEPEVIQAPPSNFDVSDDDIPF